eukprot:1139069-Pelagomonas_calceolata.AAC.1
MSNVRTDRHDIANRTSVRFEEKSSQDMPYLHEHIQRRSSRPKNLQIPEHPTNGNLPTFIPPRGSRDKRSP